METIGQILFWGGGIVALVAWVGMIRLAWEDGEVLWAVGLFFCSPLSALIYAALNWKTAGKTFLVYLGGSGVSTLGQVLVVGGVLWNFGGSSAEHTGGGDAPPIGPVTATYNMAAAQERAWVQGDQVDPAALRGSVVVVELWATWCPPCKISIPKLNALHERVAGQGVVILGVTALDGRQSADQVAAAARDEIRYPVVVVGDTSVYDAYEVRGIPHAVVVGRAGDVVWQGNPLEDDFEAAVVEAAEAPRPRGAPAPQPGGDPVGQVEGTSGGDAGEGPLGGSPVIGVELVDWSSEDVVLEKAARGAPGDRAEALRQWLQRGMDRPAGARRRMVAALPRPLDPAVEPSVLRSFREHSVSLAEALDCLAHAQGELRALLLEQVARAAPDDRDAAAQGLLRIPDAGKLDVDEALIRLGHPRAGVAVRLIEARGPEWTRTDEGRAALRALGVTRVVELAASARPEQRALGAELLGELGGQEVLAPLEGLLVDAAEPVRQAAALALGRVGSPAAAPALVKALAVEQDEPTRALLRRALASVPAQAAAEALEGLYASSDPADRRAALTGLEALARPEAVSTVLRATRDPDPEVSRAAAKALGALRASRTSGLRALIDARSGEIRDLALAAKDAETKRALRLLYHAITGRLPEQDVKR